MWTNTMTSDAAAGREDIVCLVSCKRVRVIENAGLATEAYTYKGPQSDSLPVTKMAGEPLEIRGNFIKDQILGSLATLSATLTFAVIGDDPE